MQSFEAVLRDLVRRKVITAEEAELHTPDRGSFENGSTRREAA